MPIFLFISIQMYHSFTYTSVKNVYRLRDSRRSIKQTPIQLSSLWYDWSRTCTGVLTHLPRCPLTNMLTCGGTSSAKAHTYMWWRHQMETFSTLLALCAGNAPITGEFPTQRPVTRRFDIFCDMCLNKRLNKQLWGWWFETPSGTLWRHCSELAHQMCTSLSLFCFDYDIVLRGFMYPYFHRGCFTGIVVTIQWPQIQWNNPAMV